MRLIILTSLSPNPDRIDRQIHCVASWQSIGAYVIALQSKSDLLPNRMVDAVDAFELRGNSDAGPPTVGELVRHAVFSPVHVLILNSDLEATPALAQLPTLADSVGDGCLFLVRDNHETSLGDAPIRREQWGIDGFYLRSTFEFPVKLFEQSTLRIGRPCWDYALPYAYLMRGRQLFTVAESLLLHERHQGYWSEDDWHDGANEMCRLLGLTAWEPLQAGMMRISDEIRSRAIQLVLPPA